MEVLTEHFQSFWKYYAVAGVLLLALIIYFRRWALPLLQYTVEYCIYLGLLHVGLGTIVRVASWFKDQSTMKRARGLVGQSYNPGWETPWLRFWDRELYSPEWLLYMEIIFALVVLLLMVRIRGIGVQRTKRKRGAPPKKTSEAGGYEYKARGGGSR